MVRLVVDAIVVTALVIGFLLPVGVVLAIVVVT
jgi:hypothetical protein